MKKFILILIALASFGVYAEDPPKDLLEILTSNGREKCMIDQAAKTLCDCSNPDHRKKDSDCVKNDCCIEQTEAPVVGATTASCEKTVDGNYQKALQEATDAGISTGVSGQ